MTTVQIIGGGTQMNIFFCLGCLLILIGILTVETAEWTKTAKTSVSAVSYTHLKYAGRNYFFIRVLPLFFFQSRIHINHKLELKPVIRFHQIKFCLSGFIIYNLQVCLLYTSRCV